MDFAATSTTALPVNTVIDEEGIWCQRLTPNVAPGRPALFLDRDGTIVVETGYLCKAQDTKLIAGAALVIAKANGLGIPVIVITNQSGIARGYHDWDAFGEVQDRMLADLAKDGATIDAVYACPHHGEGHPPYDHPDHPARKPNPGMLRRAAEALRLDLTASWVVGDHASDIGAGKKAGLAGGVHVRTGHGTQAGQYAAAMAYKSAQYSVHEADSLAMAMDSIPFLAGAAT